MSRPTRATAAGVRSGRAESKGRRRTRWARCLADAPLALLPVVTLLFYLASRFEALSWTTHNPRYLLPVYTSTPYIFALIAPSRTRTEKKYGAAAACVAPGAPALDPPG